jgi:hypothetical protein
VSFISHIEIRKIFSLLNNENINYILMRNVDDELPSKLKYDKDIDILVHKKDKKKLINFFKLHQFKEVRHPFKNDIYLYGADRYSFQYNSHNKILFDLNFQILVRSIEAGQWIPLDNCIQTSAWDSKRFVKKSGNFGYWTYGFEDELVTLIARCVFDKKEFQRGYIERIKSLLALVDMEEVSIKLCLIFFKFTPYLIKLIKQNRFQEIINSYFEFREY